MIKQGLFNDSILEKKFKILRTSIMLGNIRNRDEVMADYEDTAKEIDKARRAVYEEKIASKMYTTTSMEEEEVRLKELISLVESRVNERNSFIDDYIKITNNYLDDLPRVKEEDELVDYKIRLDNIHEFLSNCKEINELNDRVKSLRDELEEKYENKANSEIINSKLEDELIEEFNRYITRDSYYAGLNYTDIDDELNKIETSLTDKLDVMNTFISSYEALKNAGISGAEREEYLSYVKDSKVDYYNELEKKYVLSIYKLVLDKESDYNKLYEKRLNIDKLIQDRKNKRLDLEINARDDLTYFKDLCNEQFGVIKSQKINIDNIDKLIEAIGDCESRLEELEVANKRKEIVDLINEFSQEVPDTVKVEMPDSEEIREEVMEEYGLDEKVIPKAPNMVVKVSEPVKVNVNKAVDTAKLVMKRVVIVLEPKKFNNKRDKIKEAEEELKKEKEESIKEDSVKEEEKVTELDMTPDSNGFVTLDVNNETNSSNDDIFIDYNDEDNSHEVKINTDDDNENAKFLENLKINIDEEGSSIPTEIFIDEPKEEKPVDLFSETDPFLDDNEFEANEKNKTEAFVNGVPLVDNIGTVKPTSALSKIENASKENSNIILPTMGLTNNERTDVPIVSENYIREQL